MKVLVLSVLFLVSLPPAAPLDPALLEEIRRGPAEIELDGTVSVPIVGTRTLSATATDNVGVVGVQFLVDGNPVGAEDTTAPYSIIVLTMSRQSSRV